MAIARCGAPRSEACDAGEENDREECSNSQEDVQQRTEARKGQVIYTAAQLATYEEQYNAAQRASDNLQNKVQRAKDAEWLLARARQGQSLDRRTKAIAQDVAPLVQDPTIPELAKSSRYDAQQLAEYKRRFCDAGRQLNSIKSQLAGIAEVREVTKAEEWELADLQRAYSLQRKIWNRDHARLPHDAEIQQIAQLGGYHVEAVAVQKHRYLDAKDQHGTAQRLISAVKKKGGRLTLDDEERFLKIDEAYQLQKTVCSKLGRLGKDVAALRRKENFDKLAPSSATDTAQQIAQCDQRYRDALDQLAAFQDKISIARDSGRAITAKDKEQLEVLLGPYKQRTTERARARQGFFVSTPLATTESRSSTPPMKSLYNMIDTSTHSADFVRSRGSWHEPGKRAGRRRRTTMGNLWYPSSSGQPVARDAVDPLPGQPTLAHCQALRTCFAPNLLSELSDGTDLPY
ncbi:MAG: hypothetical protein M1826_000184 [Phylliscum demangeonii]|nr:MAG: hypothetical protein M1826_000184 [Phylliscum demangeonii]